MGGEMALEQPDMVLGRRETGGVSQEGEGVRVAIDDHAAHGTSGLGPWASAAVHAPRARIWPCRRATLER
jgi:hypothetical protein